MAKVSYNKLGLKMPSAKEFTWQDQIIEVVQYLPIEKKVEMFERILNNSVDTNGYYNITKINFNIDMEIIYTYTNVNFTEKQKEDVFKLFDNIKSSGFLAAVKENMNPDELGEIVETVWGMVRNIYEYNRSALGVMQTISTDYSNLNFDVNEIQKNLADPENVGFLKDVLSKMG